MSYEDPEPMRDSLLQMCSQALKDRPLDSSLEEYTINIPMSDGHTHKAIVARPKTESSDRPLIVLFHGGGFCAGSADLLVRPARDFAKAFDAVVVSCTYRLSPEHKFPAHFNDAMDTVMWLSGHAKQELGADTNAGFIIGGQSAGASLAAVVLQNMQDTDFSLKPTGGFICIPLLLTKDIVPQEYKDQWTSRTENADKIPLLAEEGVAKMIAAMQADSKSAKFSPFNAERPHHGLPRMYIQVGGFDPLRDDGVVYEKALRQAGVETRIDHYKEITHDTWSLFSTGESPKSFEADSLAAMKWLLRQDE